jgi:K+-sensing histidine kinase KdpD
MMFSLEKEYTLMQTIERIPQLEARARVHWQQIVLDSLMAIIGVLLITGIMAVLRLYPAIPTISILYLLLILPLAMWRGRYAAILAAIVAVLAFNFFLVPPLYTLIMPVSEWLALGVFLLTALVTSQLAIISRKNVEQAWQRERETRILYEMMHVVNSQMTFDEQLDVIALSTVRIFAAWGVRECALLLPDENGRLVIRAEAPIQIEAFALTSEHLTIAHQVIVEGKRRAVSNVLFSSGEKGYLHLLPLQIDGRILGVLALHIQVQDRQLLTLELALDEQGHLDDPRAFFWTFLDQVVLTLDRTRLRAAALGL